MARNVALNGFGRIGKSFLRALVLDKEASDKLAIRVINVGAEGLEHFLTAFQYDSLMGELKADISYEGTTLQVNNQKMRIISEELPERLPWREEAIEWVVDASGRFINKVDAEKHRYAGASKVLITAPSPSADITIIPGVNDAEYKRDHHHIISLGSCTTNCLAPLIKVIKESIGIEYGIMNTIHAYTNDQALLDGGNHHDPRRGRAAALNMVPTKTGAAQTILQLFPELRGKFHGQALRVPVPKVSFLDLTFATHEPTTIDQINNLFLKASQTTLAGIIAYSDKPLVSSDFNTSPYSAVFDGTLTTQAGPLIKIGAWYDNEYGYSCRLKDFLLHK